MSTVAEPVNAQPASGARLQHNWTKPNPGLILPHRFQMPQHPIVSTDPHNAPEEVAPGGGEILSVDVSPFAPKIFPLTNTQGPVEVPINSLHVYMFVRPRITTGVNTPVPQSAPAVLYTFGRASELLDTTDTARCFDTRNTPHIQFRDKRKRILSWLSAAVNSTADLVIIESDHDLHLDQSFGTAGPLLQTIFGNLGSTSNQLLGVNALQIALRNVLGVATYAVPSDYNSAAGNVTTVGNTISTLIGYGTGRNIQCSAFLVSGAVTTFGIDLYGLENGFYTLLGQSPVAAVVLAGGLATAAAPILSVTNYPFPVYVAKVTTITGGGTVRLEVRSF